MMKGGLYYIKKESRGGIMQKIIGCVLIIAASTGMGYLKGLDLQRYLTEMQELRQLFCMLKSEIKYTKAPLGEAFGILDAG